MIVHRGDITTVNTGFILHQVNCQGVMGSGVAKAIKQKWPKVYTDYLEYCRGKKPDDLLGHLQAVTVIPNQLTVVNLFTQRDYGYNGDRYTSYDALDQCLRMVAIAYESVGRHMQIHHPLIGCGLGGGDWRIVKAIIEKNLGTDTILWEL